jgi:hypothetical protein
MCGSGLDEPRVNRSLTMNGPALHLLPHSGTRSRSASQVSADASLGARQSPRGESEPPEEIFGPFGAADRLNWLITKKR